MSKKRKTPPQFKSEAAECAFWEANDSAAFVDWSKAQRVILPMCPTSR